MRYFRLLLICFTSLILGAATALAVYSILPLHFLAPVTAFFEQSGAFETALEQGTVFPVWNSMTHQGIGAPSYGPLPPLPYWVLGLAQLLRVEILPSMSWVTMYRIVLVLVLGVMGLSWWRFTKTHWKGQERPQNVILFAELLVSWCASIVGVGLLAKSKILPLDPLIVGMTLSVLGYALAEIFRHWNSAQPHQCAPLALALSALGMIHGFAGLAFALLLMLGFSVAALISGDQKARRVGVTTVTLIFVGCITTPYWVPLLVSRKAYMASLQGFSLGDLFKQQILTLSAIGGIMALAASLAFALRALLRTKIKDVRGALSPALASYAAIALIVGLGIHSSLKSASSLPVSVSAVEKQSKPKPPLKIYSGRVDSDCRWAKLNSFDCEIFAVTKSRIGFELGSFPGWIARLNRNVIKLDSTAPGVYSLTLAPGPHKMSLSLEPTKTQLAARLVGGIALLLALLGILGIRRARV